MMEEMIGITLFLVLGACFIVPFYLHYRLGRQKLDTLVRLSETGHGDISGVIRMLEKPDNPENNLKKGLILVAVSLPLFLANMLDGEMVGAVFMGGVPFCIGVAYLLVYQLWRNKQKQETEHSVGE